MTVIFEPLIRTKDELELIYEALAMKMREHVDLAGYAASEEGKRSHLANAGEAAGLIANLHDRLELSKRIGA